MTKLLNTIYRKNTLVYVFANLVEKNLVLSSNNRIKTLTEEKGGDIYTVVGIKSII